MYTHLTKHSLGRYLKKIRTSLLELESKRPLPKTLIDCWLS